MSVRLHALHLGRVRAHLGGQVQQDQAVLDFDLGRRAREMMKMMRTPEKESKNKRESEQKSIR